MPWIAPCIARADDDHSVRAATAVRFAHQAWPQPARNGRGTWQLIIDTLDKVPLLYHFTDRRNLPLIREMGGLHPLAGLLQKDVKIRLRAVIKLVGMPMR